MKLYGKIEDDIKSALKAQDALKVSVLRMVLAAVKTLEIDRKIKRAQDNDVLSIIQKQIKQHKDSIEQFGKGGRKDLEDKEKKELVILESYMPEQLTEDELENIVKEAIASTGAQTKSDVGKVMKEAMDKGKGRADGKAVNQVAMRILK
jgi:uncharacterized protein